MVSLIVVNIIMIIMMKIRVTAIVMRIPAIIMLAIMKTAIAVITARIIVSIVITVTIMMIITGPVRHKPGTSSMLGRSFTHASVQTRYRV